MIRSVVTLKPSDNANITVQDDTSCLVPVNLGTLSDVNDAIDSPDQVNIDCVIFEEAMADHSYCTAAMSLSPFVDNIIVYK